MFDWDKHFEKHGTAGAERISNDFSERAAITKIIQTIIETYGKPIFDGKRVLDYGCGAGRFVKMFRKASYYIGVDIVESNIEYCKKKYPNEYFYLINRAQPILPDVDVIFTSTVIQHIRDLTELRKEFKRVLGGSLIMFENFTALSFVASFVILSHC